MKYMKRVIMIGVFGFFSFFAKAQADEIQQLVLDLQKLTQLKSILQELYKGYEVVSNGYETVKNISKGNFNLHQVFLDGLLAVSPAVQNYKRVADIINNQVMILHEYKNAFSRFKQYGYFNVKEIDYIGKVYGNLFNASLKNLDELAIILTASKLRMSDEERLKSIDRINTDMLDKLTFLRHFNNNTSLMVVQRAKEHNDVTTIQSLYGIK